MEILPLWLAEKTVGEVRLVPEGLYVRCRVRCAPRSDGLYRANLLGERGTIPLGVLAPEDGALALERRIPRGELASLGALRGGQAVRSFSFAMEEGFAPIGIERCFRAPQLERALRELPGALFAAEGERRRLALPYAQQQPFPLPELFCFASLRAIGGQNYIIYAFDGQERPIF